MSDAPPASPAPAPPTADPVVIRDEFHRLVHRELVGPAGEEDEEVAEHKVSGRYLCGWLAPAHTGRGPETSPTETALPIADQENPEEGLSDDPVVGSDSLLPNSFGFTFCVARGTASIRLRVGWGWYRRGPSKLDHQTPKGNPKGVWHRTPIERDKLIQVREGELEPWHPHAETPEVRVVGRVLPHEDGSHLVSVFLLNEQDGREGGEERWLFQAWMEASSPDADGCFIRRCIHPAASTVDPMERQEYEEALLAYRHRQEFAVGHGVAVDWTTVQGDPTCATSVRTDSMPAFEVPRSRPRDIEGLETRMKELAGAEPAALPELLRTLTREYGAWIERERERVRTPDQTLQDRGGD
jgi:hypothetical protein